MLTLTKPGAWSWRKGEQRCLKLSLVPGFSGKVWHVIFSFFGGDSECEMWWIMTTTSPLVFHLKEWPVVTKYIQVPVQVHLSQTLTFEKMILELCSQPWGWTIGITCFVFKGRCNMCFHLHIEYYHIKSIPSLEDVKLQCVLWFYFILVVCFVLRCCLVQIISYSSTSHATNWIFFSP